MTFFYDLNKRLADLDAKQTLSEGKTKPDFLDVDKDGNKKETFKKAVADKKKSIEESLEEQWMVEKWGTDTEVSPSKKGMFKGKTKTELLSQLSKLKQSGPHEKGSAAYTKMKELQFAIRAKSGWGKVSEEELDEKKKDKDFKPYVPPPAKFHRGMEEDMTDEGAGVMHFKDQQAKAKGEKTFKLGDKTFPVKEEQNADIPLKGKSSPGTDFQQYGRDIRTKLRTDRGVEPGKDLDENSDGIGDVMSPEEKAEKMKRLRQGRDYFEADVTGLGDSKYDNMEEDAHPIEANTDKPAYNGMEFESEEMNEASISRAYFKEVAEMLRGIEDIAQRRMLAQHHAELFARKNPRFDKQKFFDAAGVPTRDLAEAMKLGDKRPSSTGGTIEKIKGGVRHTAKSVDTDDEDEDETPKRKVGRQFKDADKKHYDFTSDEKALAAHKRQPKGKVHAMKEEEMDEAYYTPRNRRREQEAPRKSVADIAKATKANKKHELSQAVGKADLLNYDDAAFKKKFKMTKKEYERKHGRVSEAEAMYTKTKDGSKFVGHVDKKEKVAEKAVSKAQQQAAGIALAAKKAGKTLRGKSPSAEMEKMSTKELEKFASTKRTGLPKKVKEDGVESNSTAKSYPDDVPTVGNRESVSKPGQGYEYGKGIYEAFNTQVEAKILQINESVDVQMARHDVDGAETEGEVIIRATGAEADMVKDLLRNAGLINYENDILSRQQDRVQPAQGASMSDLMQVIDGNSQEVCESCGCSGGCCGTKKEPTPPVKPVTEEEGEVCEACGCGSGCGSKKEPTPPVKPVTEEGCCGCCGAKKEPPTPDNTKVTEEGCCGNCGAKMPEPANKNLPGIGDSEVAFEIQEEYGDTDPTLNAPDYPTNQEESDDALQYSGGLDGPKSTGQSTTPVLASQLKRQATMEDVSDADSFLNLFKVFKNIVK